MSAKPSSELPVLIPVKLVPETAKGGKRGWKNDGKLFRNAWENT